MLLGYQCPQMYSNPQDRGRRQASLASNKPHEQQLNSLLPRLLPQYQATSVTGVA
jgi:hypothetical protein